MTSFRLRPAFAGCGIAVLMFWAHRSSKPWFRTEASADFASLPESFGSPRKQVNKPPLGSRRVERVP
jgi:hypothetical protein